METASDMVNQPPHYKGDGSVECIHAIEAQLTTEEYRGFLKGNVVKYVWRERLKGADSLHKAAWYLERLNRLDTILALAAGVDEAIRLDSQSNKSHQ